MNKIVAAVSASALAIAAAVKFPGSQARPPAAPPRQVASATAPSIEKTPEVQSSAKHLSRREEMARLVAETAAATADQTARRALAEKSSVQETALR